MKQVNWQMAITYISNGSLLLFVMGYELTLLVLFPVAKQNKVREHLLELQIL